MNTTVDPYYIRPDLFLRKVKTPALKTKAMVCRWCGGSFVAKYRWGQAPNYCSKACIKARAAADHIKWVNSNPEHFRELCRASHARKAKRAYVRKG